MCMNDDMDYGELVRRMLRNVAAFFLGVMICALVGMLCSCKSVRYVSVPEYHTEYKTRVDSFILKDTAWVHDSVSVWMKGDTIWKEKYKTEYKVKYVDRISQDTIWKRDSVRVPYPVERKLGWWEQKKVDYFAPVLMICCILLVSLWMLIRKRIQGRNKEQD